MANLETLELTINGNAESASQGLKNLIGSLSALSKVVGKNVGGLRLLNKEIANMKGIKSLNIGSASGNVRAVQAQTKALTENAKATKTWAEAQVAANPAAFTNYRTKSQGAFKFKPSGAVLKPAPSAVRPVADNKNGVPINWDAKVEEVKEAAPALKTVANEVKNVGNETERTKTKVSGLSKVFSRVGRIFSTMMIRTAIRSLIKAFSEAWQNAYQFSKSMGGEFAESVDKAKSLLAGTATNIISAFSPALTALIPIIQTVAASIQYLCNIIKSLFSLIGGGTDLFGATADSINKFAGSASGGGKAAKEMLANFDELNVISQESGGGGGGGGGYTSGLLSGIVSDEMAKVQLIVSESLLALGLIMACTGHIGLGVGLMAIGAAGIAKTVLEDWGKLPAEVQGELAKIMTIVGVASLALGAILAFSGVNIPLGIGLMAIGAVNLAAVQYVNWTSGLSDEVKSTITTIMGIVGGALLVLGAILAFSGANIPLGIGLMIAGGISLASAVGLNWTTLSGRITGAFETVKTALVNGWETVKKAVNDAWNAVAKWWEDSGVGPGVRKVWGDVSGFFRGLWDGVSEFAGKAWSSISKWWHTNVTANIEKEGIWGGVKGYFTGIWNGISELASAAWEEVKKWWESSGVGEWVRRAWNDVGNFMTNSIWNPIKNTAKSAWDTVKNWWESSGVGEWVRRAWNDVGNFLTNSIWKPVKSSVVDAWNNVKKWWEDSGIGEKVRAAWNSVKSVFEDIFKPIKDALDWLKEILGFNGKTVNMNVNVATSETGASSKVVQSVVTTNASKNQSNNSGGNFFTNIVNTAKNLLGIHANGAFDIPRGELFIAQEAGAELIGSINGKTSVANQTQIIEGISSGVERANAEQNALLRQQNELLRGILEKDASVRIGASAAFGRVARQSLDMYSGMTGG